MRLEEAVRRMFEHVDRNDIDGANRLFDKTLNEARRAKAPRRRPSWRLLVPVAVLVAGALLFI